MNLGFEYIILEIQKISVTPLIKRTKNHVSVMDLLTKRNTID